MFAGCLAVQGVQEAKGEIILACAGNDLLCDSALVYQDERRGLVDWANGREMTGLLRAGFDA